MAPDYVPPAVQFDQFRLAQKAPAPDAICRNEEMPAPAAPFQQVRNRVVKAHSAVVKGEQYWTAFQIANRKNRSARGGDRVQVPREIVASQLVDMRAFAGKT